MTQETYKKSKFKVYSEDKMRREVNRLHKEGVEIKKIGKKLDLSLNSIYRYLQRDREKRVIKDNRFSFEERFNIEKLELLRLIRKMKEKKPENNRTHWSQENLKNVVEEYLGDTVTIETLNRILKTHNINWKDIRYVS